MLSTANGMAIRFNQSDARPMGRNTSGVKGITLTEGDELVGMVVADPNATLLTACEKGYGKRTQFGPNSEDEGAEDEASSNNRYRVQKRGGKGVRDIKTTDRNGKVIGILPVNDEDEILLMTSRGKLQRIACNDIKTIGRNTQGVRIMSLDDDDSLAVVVRVPRDEGDDGDTETESSPTPETPAPAADVQSPSDSEAESDATPESESGADDES